MYSSESTTSESMLILEKDMEEMKTNFAKLYDVIGPVADRKIMIVLDDDGSVKQVVFQPGAKGFMTGAEINNAIMAGLAQALKTMISSQTLSPRSSEDKQRLMNNIRWRREHGISGACEPFISWDENVEIQVAGDYVVMIKCDEDWLRSARERTISDAIADATKKALASQRGKE